MLSKAEIYSNINTEWEISQEYLKESRYGLCKYIVDVCQAIRVSNDVASIAMSLTNYFFVKKCYFNYEKLTLACAAILLASKQENAQNKFNEISKEYFRFNSKIFNQINSVLKSEDNQKIKDKIATYEITLLKSLHFDIKIDLPFDFIYVYSIILYPDNETDIVHTSVRVANDSFFTYANNVYKNYIVAVSCITIAAKFLAIPTVFDKEFKHIDNMRKLNVKGRSQEEFEKSLISWDNKSVIIENGNGIDKDRAKGDSDYFDKLTIAEKIHPKMSMDDLIGCIEMIMEFYIDAKNTAKKNEASK